MLNEVCQRRLEKCGRLMKEAGLDVLLLTKPSNMFYFTGDGRLCAYAMVTKGGKVALGVPQTDVEDVEKLAHFDHIAGFEDEVGMTHSIAHDFARFDIEEGVLGVEYTFLTQSMMSMVTHPHGKPKGVTVKDCTHVISELRVVKEAEEIELMIAAARVADKGMGAAVEGIEPGISESQVAAEAECAMRQAGAEDFWRSYVSSGPRTNIAHRVPSSRKLQSGDLVMVDIHPIVRSYSADICRTICVGKPTAEQLAAYNLYLRGQQATIAGAKAGVTMGELEKALHTIIQEAGHGEHLFGPLIHGIGIDFEESPLPAGHAFFHGEKAPPPLQANTVIAVGNCGLYTGPWGVRIEDTVVVGKEAPQVLTGYPRKLVA
jgi:Xaa-Pro aminopeptidase